MRGRSSTSPFVGARGALVALVACAALAACADAPSEPGITREPLAPRAASRALAPTSLYGATYVEAFDVYRPEGVSAADSTFFPDSAFWLKAPAIWQPTALGAALPSPMPGDTAYHAFSPFYAEIKPALATWAIVKHDRDDAYAMRPMEAWHRATDCAAPPATHTVSSYERSTYLCRNHMMTAVNARTYGVTYLTPDRLLDLSSIATSPAVVRFDVATLRASKNDWIDLWVVPYEDNLVAPLDEGLKSVDLQGQPERGLHVRMTADDRVSSAFRAYYIADHKAYPLPAATTAGYETRFAQSATVRRRFELRITNNTVSFGMPDVGLWWILDARLPASISGSGIRRAIVQIGHHSMGVTQQPGDSPTTWHWDNVGVSPSVPFTIINADRRLVDQATATPVAFGRPAPTESHLRFAGYGSNFQVSFDGGPWQRAQTQREQFNIHGRFRSYWTPVPAGTTRVAFRASNDPTDGKKAAPRWIARDVSIWSPNP